MEDQGPRLTLNVGGRRFDITSATLSNVPDGAGKLANLKRLLQTEENCSGEYYFDRDPEAFETIINYCRSGFLHVPLVRISHSYPEMNILKALTENTLLLCSAVWTQQFYYSTVLPFTNVGMHFLHQNKFTIYRTTKKNF